MVIALVNGKRLRADHAKSGTIGICPWTNREVKAKVGEIRQYWVYTGEKPILPDGYEPETEWHCSWKYPVQDEFCEVICGFNKEHRADIIGKNNIVIEIQNSNIDIRIVRQRTNFYRLHSKERVIWVVNATDYWRKRLKLISEPRNDAYFPVEWKHARHWVLEIAKSGNSNLFLDYNFKSDYLFKMWVHNNILQGRFIKKVDFFKEYILENAKEEYKNNPDAFLKIWQ